MDVVISATARLLTEADSSLEHASVGKIISTGLLLGIVHVLTGPDHLSALAAMATGGSFKAFALGVRWGCGHSLGLLIMAGIFFAAGQTIDLDTVGEYLNYVVGVFMIALGSWTGRSIYRKYEALEQEKTGSPSCDDLEANFDTNRGNRNSSAKLPTVVELNSEPRGATAATSTSISVPGGRVENSPSSSFFLVVNNKAGNETAGSNSLGTPTMALSPKWDEEPKTFKEKYCTNMSFENPMMQRVRSR
ncbi:unnamed protein product [Phytophthora fragariaefolia]|uniref:Unnamed protein product n=1 Tax=Phytophthora fragariaefolia TaxID=1490495 RepID=A0A9W6YCG6_9STRA|nr:unnamed protein product [Phytophthora fragariaefolia]